ncbi:DUF3089 domain-containing protein [Rhodococcus sp. NPDC003318]|uniref:DUF3089 domain-containing protein n=1 Tax=Rhodococcus sp. NPDC003318 TaxID=3364503 RepID=UPI0036B51EEA
MAISRRARTVVVLVWAALLSALVIAPPATADSGTTWLCRPGQPDDPCGGRDGAPIDCFYLYPTASLQLSTNANHDRSPELQAVARAHTEPFGAHCNVWVPVYRQVTLRALFTGTPDERAAALEVAYADVERAWDDYLTHHNDGRGVVLIGHSQGTRMLRSLIRDHVDGRPVQSQLVSALLLGGNVLVREGDVVGGDFTSVPACTNVGQTGCVVAYSAFSRTPPPDTRYGLSTAPGLEVLCTNPASLHDNSDAPLHARIGGVEVDAFHGRCTDGDGPRVLMVDGPGAALLPALPNESWGLHLLDVNIAQRDLVDLVAAQSATYLR